MGTLSRAVQGITFTATIRAGDYANNMPAHYLTAMVLDCCGYKNIKLKFRHWLDIGPNSGTLNAGDFNMVEVCLNDAAGIEQ